MIDAVLANRWTKAQDLYHNKKITNIEASAMIIYKMLEEVVLGAYRSTKVSFIS